MRISKAQEEHAQACEKLGIAKCRITGMRYHLVGERDVEAMLALRLAPELARNFGKEATKLIEQNEGMLSDQEISGEDVGTRIGQHGKSIDELRLELARLEARIEQDGDDDNTDIDRGSLEMQAIQLRNQIRELENSQGADVKRLTGTPMVFEYDTGGIVPGFDMRSPLKEALQTAADNFVGAIGFLLIIIATLAPWAILIGLALWIRQRLGFVPLWRRRANDATEETAQKPSAAVKSKPDN